MNKLLDELLAQAGTNERRRINLDCVMVKVTLRSVCSMPCYRERMFLFIVILKQLRLSFCLEVI